MTSAAERRRRVLRVRQIEHRIAQVHLADADAALAKLNALNRRLAGLRAQLRLGEGAVDGFVLNALQEMATRVDSAERELAAPIAEAQRARARFDALRLAAHIREESADRLTSRAERLRNDERARQADANRPARPRPGQPMRTRERT